MCVLVGLAAGFGVLPSGVEAVVQSMRPAALRLFVVDLCIGLCCALAAVAVATVVLQVMRQARVPGLTAGVLRLAAPAAVTGLFAASLALAGMHRLAPWTWRVAPEFACAAVLYLCGFVVRLRWTLSSEQLGLLATQQLRSAALSEWRQVAGFRVVQSVYADAIRRGNDAAAASIALALSDVLLAQANVERREHTQASLETVRELTAGCIASACTGSLEATLHCGRLVAAALLCAVALDPLSGDCAERLAEVIRDSGWGGSERSLALWSGTREALFKNASRRQAFVLRYWLQRRTWTADDPRWAVRVAEGVAALHRATVVVLDSGHGVRVAGGIASQTLAEAYHDIATDVGPTLRRTRRTPLPLRRSDLPLALLDSMQSRALQAELRDDPEARVVLSNAYEHARADLTHTFYGARLPHVSSSLAGV